MSDDDISATIVAKSDQWNADDLVSGPVTCTVERVAVGDTPEQPVSVWLSGRNVPWKPCKTERRVLAAAWGSKSRAWIGRALTLYRDEAVLWGGKPVGGIRIAAMSHIAKPMTVSLAVAKGKKADRRIDVLAAPPASPDRLVAALRDAGWYDDAVATFGERPTWDVAAVKAWATARKEAAAARQPEGEG